METDLTPDTQSPAATQANTAAGNTSAPAHRLPGVPVGFEKIVEEEIHTKVPNEAQKPTASVPHAYAPTNPKDILLPKKNAPSVQSAQRVNAAVVLEAANAALQQASPQTAATPSVPLTSSTTPAPAPKAEEVVTPLHTYKSDVEQAVSGQKFTLAGIVTAQAQSERKASKTASPAAIRNTSGGSGIGGMVFRIGAGLVLLAAAGSLAAFVFVQPSTAPTANTPVSLAGSFMRIDATQQVILPRTISHSDLMQTLVQNKNAVSLALGLTAQLLPAWASTTPATAVPLTAQELMALLAPNAPNGLTRSLTSPYLLGVHSFDNNQAFLVFKTDSYETAYAGMLAWEYALNADLSPLFLRTPKPHIPEEQLSTTTPAPQVLPTTFTDQVIQNHDTRVLQNNSGDVLLLWTFIDRNTLVITTNENTLSEIITRLSEASVVPIPWK